MESSGIVIFSGGIVKPMTWNGLKVLFTPQTSSEYFLCDENIRLVSKMQFITQLIITCSIEIEILAIEILENSGE